MKERDYTFGFSVRKSSQVYKDWGENWEPLYKVALNYKMGVFKNIWDLRSNT